MTEVYSNLPLIRIAHAIEREVEQYGPHEKLEQVKAELIALMECEFCDSEARAIIPYGSLGRLRAVCPDCQRQKRSA